MMMQEHDDNEGSSISFVADADDEDDASYSLDLMEVNKNSFDEQLVKRKMATLLSFSLSLPLYNPQVYM